LLIAGLIALRRLAGISIATGPGRASCAGCWAHYLRRALLPQAAPGHISVIAGMGAPIPGLTFSLTGCSASALHAETTDSGVLATAAGGCASYSKSQAYFYMVGMGAWHGDQQCSRCPTGFVNPWLCADRRSFDVVAADGDDRSATTGGLGRAGGMGPMIAVGMPAVLHDHDLTASGSSSAIHRGAVLAPCFQLVVRCSSCSA
jgi:hypothetical protein